VSRRDLDGVSRSVVDRVRRDWERATEQRLDELAAAVRLDAEAALAHATEQAVRAAREHTEAALAEALDRSTAAAREHAGAVLTRESDRVIQTAHEHAEAASSYATEQAVRAAHEHTNAAVGVAVRELTTQISVLRRELSQLTALAARGPLHTEARNDPSAAVIDGVTYAAIEDRFRGSFEEIASRQARYVPYVETVVDDAHPALDLGSGRGEWLSLLIERSLAVRGVDSNPVAVATAVNAGLPAEEGDLIDVLRRAADGSFGAITMFQVVEHLPFDLLVTVLGECCRVLRPGGVLIAETPNALNVRVASANFWLDPTHQRPVHPELLRFLATRAGFVRTEDVFANELAPMPDLGDLPSSAAAVVGELVARFSGPGDYALVAWTGLP